MYFVHQGMLLVAKLNKISKIATIFKEKCLKSCVFSFLRQNAIGKRLYCFIKRDLLLANDFLMFLWGVILIV